MNAITDDISVLEASLDGVPLRDLFRYRAESPDGGWLYYRCDAAYVTPTAPGFTYELFGRRVPGPQAFPPTFEDRAGAESVYYASWRVRIYLGHPEPLDAPVLDAPFLERTSHPNRTYKFTLGGWGGDVPPTQLQVEAVRCGAPALRAKIIKKGRRKGWRKASASPSAPTRSSCRASPRGMLRSSPPISRPRSSPSPR